LKTRVAPSVALEQEITELLEQGISDSEDIARLGRQGAQLVIPKRIEDEVADFLQRVRYERTALARGTRNGNRPRHVMTAEGELEIQIPQLRNTAEKFISRIPDTRTAIRTRPLEALIIGAHVRGLVRPRHRGPAQGSRAGQGLTDHGRPDLPGTACSLRRLPGAQPGPDRRIQSSISAPNSA
jgi:Transposase, Mutator family